MKVCDLPRFAKHPELKNITITSSELGLQIVIPDDDNPNLVKEELCLSSFPGCCGGLVLHSFYLHYDSFYLHHGSSILFTFAMALIQDKVNHGECGNILFATSIRDQTEFVKFLKKHRFTRVTRGKNVLTENMVTVWTKVVR